MAGKGKMAFDISSHLGIIMVIGSILAAYSIEGGKLAALFNIPALVLVGGGSVALSFFCNPLPAVMTIPKLFIIAFFGASPNTRKTVDKLQEYAVTARREGLLKLEEEVAKADSEILRKGLQLIVDGAPPDRVEEMLYLEMEQIQGRHKSYIGIFDTLGAFGPTLGIIGTVMGLVSVLGKLGDSDPAKLGESIATAFIATLYGVAIANVLWIPLANKLKAKDRLETLANEITVSGLISIMHGDNPAIVKEKLTSFLPTGARADKGGKKGGNAGE